MKFLGYALITVGFLVGAYNTSLDPLEVPKMPFFAGVATAIIGVIVVRVATRMEATHEDKLTADIGILEDSLTRLVERSRQLEADKDDVDVYELRHRIDADFRDDLGAFAAARESIAHSYGLQPYAEIMNHFAAGERYINRVWSASTDGWIDEAQIYIAKAAGQFAEAQKRFQSLRQPGGPTAPA